jgi:hypothetical protein
MECYATFRKGRWVEYKPTATVISDPRWTDAHRWMAAAAYATAITKGLPEARAIILSEAYVFKQLYPELSYTKDLEASIASITRE